MGRVEDEREGEHARRRVPGRFYISKRFPKDHPDQPERRFSYEVADTETGDLIFESDDGWELILRETPSRQQLKAVFFESSRDVSQLAFQRFTSAGKPIDDKKTLLLGAREVARLKAFLAKIEVAELEGAEAVRFSEAGIRQLMEGVGIPAHLLSERVSDVAEFLRTDLTAPEVTALARRREKLGEFRRRLDQQLSEPDWQQWLEAEPWILGLGAAPQFLHKAGDKLEQLVSGFDMTGGGSRPDAVLRTAAQLSSLVFVEIKTPDAPLLKKSSYRSLAWVPDADVVGGVSQLHSVVDAARRSFGERLPLKDHDGFDTGLIVELCMPRSILVVGHLSSLENNDGKPHRERFRSFESYRRALREPEILTFDELLNRAEAAMLLDAAATQSADL